MSLIGDVIGLIGNRRDERNTLRANTAEDARQEAEMRRRAGGRAALMRGILDANGYGGTMTDAQIFDTLLHTARRGTKPMSSVLPGIANIGQNLEDTLIRGSAAIAAPGAPAAVSAGASAAAAAGAGAGGTVASTAAPTVDYYALLRTLQNSPPPR